MTCVDLHGVQLVRLRVDDLQEAKRLLNAGGNTRVLRLEVRVANVTETPVKGPVQVGKSRRESSPDVVQSGSGVVVRSSHMR